MILLKKLTIKKIIINLAVVFFLTQTLSACVKTAENRGYVKNATVQIDRIKIGITSQKDVQYLLGSPSSKSSFGKDKWYYIGFKMERSAYLRPQIIDQNILIVSFDDSGLVEDIIHKGAEDRRNIAFSEESTPTEGNKITVVEQLLGNLGRYNAGQ